MNFNWVRTKPTNREVFLSKCVTGRDMKQSMADNRPWKHKQLMHFEIFSINKYDHHVQNHYKQLTCGEQWEAFLFRSERPEQGKDVLSLCSYGNPH